MTKKKTLGVSGIFFFVLVCALVCLVSCHSSTDICKGNHQYQKGEPIPATCTENAYDVYICSVCGDSYRTVIADTALGHRFEDGFCVVCGYADTPALVREGPLLFTLNKEGNAYTVKIDSAKVEGAVAISATCYNLPVIEIEEGGFKNQSGMTSVTIPDSITAIGKSAFEGCTGLTSVTFGLGVLSVGERAFFGCSELTEVTMCKSVDEIGAAAFGGCGKMQKMVLPFIGGQGEYFNISSAHPENGPKYVLGYIFGKQSFQGAQKVAMCHDNDPWGNQLVSYFYIPSSLSKIEVLQGNYTIAYYYGARVKKNFTLVQGALDGCSMVKELVLHEQITGLDVYALRGCSGLETLIAPGVSLSSYGVSPYLNLKTFEGRSFYKDLTPNVTDLTLHFVTKDQAFTNLEGYDKLTDFTLVFDKDVKKIKLENLAPVLGKLTGLVLPSPSVEIEEGILSGITTLKRAALPYNRLAGLDMSSLEQLSILSDVPYTVPQILFARAPKLQSLTLDARVNSFPANAFVHCTMLSTVTLNGTSESLTLEDAVGRWLAISFGGANANPLCHGASLYFDTANGLYSAQRLTLPETTATIGAYTFDGCRNLEEIILGGRVVSIGENAFANTPALLTVQFQGTVSAWCSISFDGSAANPINGANALVIDGKTVSDLTGLTAQTVSDYAFYGYKGLVAATIPSGVGRIGAYAFAACPALAHLTVPASVTRIDAFAFENCTALYSATFDDPSGWWRYGDLDAGGLAISSYSLESPARAADVLVVTYVHYVFRKVG